MIRTVTARACGWAKWRYVVHRDVVSARQFPTPAAALAAGAADTALCPVLTDQGEPMPDRELARLEADVQLLSARVENLHVQTDLLVKAAQELADAVDSACRLVDSLNAALAQLS